MKNNDTKKQEKKVRAGGTITGKVVSTSMMQSAIVEVPRFRRHRLYGKAIRRSRRLAVHVADVAVVKGDMVEIAQTRPISKTKRFVIVSKLS